MPSKKFYYHNLGYWFLLFVVLVAAAFYTTYFIRIFEPTPATIHIHFVLMALWLMMLIAQPFLIKYKKLKWHRLLGKISYVLVPLLLFVSFLLIRNGYYRDLDSLNQKVAAGLQHYSQEEILKRIASMPIGLFYFFWFIIFYSLAIRNRRTSSKHARYMLATALTLTGPTVDRILGIHFHLETIGGVSSFIVSFLLIDLILGCLLYADYKLKRDTSALRTALLVYITGQVIYFVVPKFEWWAVFMKHIMLPEP